MNDIVDIKLIENEIGYDKVADYVRRYWEHNIFTDVVVSIGVSYNGVDYSLLKEVASPHGVDDVEFLNDWWEGERFIKLFGIKSLEQIDIFGGIYEQ